MIYFSVSERNDVYHKRELFYDHLAKKFMEEEPVLITPADFEDNFEVRLQNVFILLLCMTDHLFP